MNTPFRTTNVRPENAVLVYSLNLKKNKAALWAMNGASVLLLFLFGWLFLWYLLRVRPGILAEVASIRFGLFFPIALIGVYAVMIVVHELIHGLFFWIFTRQRPKFGFRGWYAYAAAPGWFFPRRQYVVVGLAPFALLSILGMILMAILPAEMVVIALFVTIINAASSVGDLWVIFRLICQRRQVIVEDQGDGVSFYTLS